MWVHDSLANGACFRNWITSRLLTNRELIALVNTLFSVLIASAVGLVVLCAAMR